MNISFSKTNWLKYAAVALAVSLSSMFAVTPVIANASYYTAGRMPSTAFTLEDGSTGSLSWTSSDDHLNYYLKFTLNAQGVANLSFTKPTDSEGELGSLNLSLYKGDNTSTAIWTDNGYYSKNDASPIYNFKMGLGSGTYYLAIKPGFIVESGTIVSTYTYSFEARDDYEVEPNTSASSSTPLGFNKRVYGSFGGKDNDDYYLFSATAGNKYRIYIGNFATINPTSTIIDLMPTDGEKVGLTYKLQDGAMFDEDGDYYEWTCTQNQRVIIHVWNYHQAPYDYSILIKEIEPAPTVTTPAPTVTTPAPTVTTPTPTVAPTTTTAQKVSTFKAKAKKITVKATAGKKWAKVVWKKISGAAGYQIRYSKYKSMKGSKTIKIVGGSRRYKVIRKLTAKKKYYFQVRAYKRIDGKIYYGAWSAKKAVRIKK